MNIIIQLAGTVSAAAAARVRAVSEATEQNDPSFNGDSISVEQGDFACIAAGEGHKDAARLFALVQRIIEPGFEFETESAADGVMRVKIPFAEGGYIRVPA